VQKAGLPGVFTLYMRLAQTRQAYVYVSTQSGVYCASVTRHNALETVLKRAYFMTGLTECSACDVHVINRRETGVSLWMLITFQTLW